MIEQTLPWGERQNTKINGQLCTADHSAIFVQMDRRGTERTLLLYDLTQSAIYDRGPCQAHPKRSFAFSWADQIRCLSSLRLLLDLEPPSRWPFPITNYDEESSRTEVIQITGNYTNANNEHMKNADFSCKQERDIC